MNFRSTLIKSLQIHCYDHRSLSPTFKLKKTCNLAKSPRLTLTTQKMVDAKQAWFLFGSFVNLRSRPALCTSKSKMAVFKRISGKEKIVYFWLWFWGIPDVIAFITIWCFKINLIIGILKAKLVTSHLQKIFISFLLIVWIVICESFAFPTVRHLESFCYFERNMIPCFVWADVSIAHPNPLTQSRRLEGIMGSPLTMGSQQFPNFQMHCYFS